jgi:hypothetical protein
VPLVLEKKRRNIILLMLSFATFRILLNGGSRQAFSHRRAIRHGDPRAPMLFILALEPLHRILMCATANGLLSAISWRAERMRVSFYADDAALFLNPTKSEVSNVFELLELFRQNFLDRGSTSINVQLRASLLESVNT